jgi:hypothetical protein
MQEKCERGEASRERCMQGVLLGLNRKEGEGRDACMVRITSSKHEECDKRSPTVQAINPHRETSHTCEVEEVVPCIVRQFKKVVAPCNFGRREYLTES